MTSNLSNLVLVLSLARTFMRNNPYYTFAWIFMNYLRHKLNKLTSTKTKIQYVPDKIHAELVKSFVGNCEYYVDYKNCALGKLDDKNSCNAAFWGIVCSKVTHRKYKVLIIPYEGCEDGQIFVSETMKCNLENTLCHPMDETLYFVMPETKEKILCAAEAKISLICNPHDCSNEMIDCLLENYFRVPRYLKARDLFGIELKDYAPDYFYSSTCSNLNKVYFRVNSLRVKRETLIESTGEICWLVKGETSLTQEANIHAYLPREFTEAIDIGSSLCERIEKCNVRNYPPALEKSMETLKTCISPFLQKNNWMKIRPAFLVNGAPGSGKFKLIQSLAKRNGLNLFNVDFADIQCMSAPQTEAKLRIVMQNARNCVPCILRLSNIQIFGKNMEGHKDERIISSFASELNKLTEKKSLHPLIVIATLENDELDADIERLFIETICIDNLERAQRAETLSWILETKGLRHQADLPKIAGLASDFVLADLDALVTQAAIISYRSSSLTISSLVLPHENFVQACESMQSQFSDRVGAPRIPKVYWEDIGGLAKLKHEIKRRIELPMLTGMNLGRSGLLLYGPPGTGKTLLAKAVATECQLHFMSIKGPELLNMYVGQSEKNIRQVFERARSSAPCVIFFDELDSLAPNRGRSGDSGGVMDRVVSQLLSEMDGLETSGNIFIIGATNRPDLIDPALLRPGRFDKLLYVGIYADHDTQLSVLRAVTRRFKLKNDGDELEKLVKHLPSNLTGADLYAVCSDAWLIAVRRNLLALEEITDKNVQETTRRETYEYGVVVELQDFMEAARDLVPSVSNEELARYEKLKAELSST